MSPDAEPAQDAAAERLFDESPRPEFQVLRRRLLRFYRIRSALMGLVITATLGFGVFFLALPATAGGSISRGALFIVLGAAAILLFRRDLDVSRRQATQSVVVRKSVLELRNLPPSRRKDLEVPLDSIVRLDLGVTGKVGPALMVQWKGPTGEIHVSHYCHLVVDRRSLRTALSLALPGKVRARGWDPPEKPPGRPSNLPVSHINR